MVNQWADLILIVQSPPVLYFAQFLSHNQSQLIFVGAGTFPYVTWGCGFVDFDNDDDPDIFVVCGPLEDNIEVYDTTSETFNLNTLLMNTVDGESVNVSTVLKSAGSAAGPTSTKTLR